MVRDDRPDSEPTSCSCCRSCWHVHATGRCLYGGPFRYVHGYQPGEVEAERIRRYGLGHEAVRA